MKLIKILVILLLVQSCSSLMPQTRTITMHDINIEALAFTASSSEIIESLKTITKSKKWKILHNDDELPTKDKSMYSNSTFEMDSKSTTHISLDHIAWNRILNSHSNSTTYIQILTKKSLSSYGAEIFIVIYEPEAGKVILEIAAGTTQISEKKKLDSYISSLSEELNLIHNN